MPPLMFQPLYEKRIALPAHSLPPLPDSELQPEEKTNLTRGKGKPNRREIEIQLGK